MEPELNISVGFDAGWMPSVDPCDKRERERENNNNNSPNGLFCEISLTLCFTHVYICMYIHKV